MRAGFTTVFPRPDPLALTLIPSPAGRGRRAGARWGALSNTLGQKLCALSGSRINNCAFLRPPISLELRPSWGGSSAGRALRSQCRGREFDPPPLHHSSRWPGFRPFSFRDRTCRISARISGNTAPVAQWIEQSPPKRQVARSIRVRGTRFGFWFGSIFRDALALALSRRERGYSY